MFVIRSSGVSRKRPAYIRQGVRRGVLCPLDVAGAPAPVYRAWYVDEDTARAAWRAYQDRQAQTRQAEQDRFARRLRAIERAQAAAEQDAAEHARRLAAQEQALLARRGVPPHTPLDALALPGPAKPRRLVAHGWGRAEVGCCRYSPSR
ncbi:MAG: hypothetical protein K6V97_11090 [Actinomycetia bacterium]|nr:hypothetical protein [Actinomycetes bacterium]